MSLSDSKMRLLRALEVLCDRSPAAVVELPMRIDSRANRHVSNHWGPRHETSRKQRTAAFVKCRTTPRLTAWAQRELDGGGVVVRVVRISPRELDSHDNLGMALKACTDGVADYLGVNDRDPRVVFVPDQERGAVGVRIEFYRRAE
jgi:hypothetical protein